MLDFQLPKNGGKFKYVIFVMRVISKRKAYTKTTLAFLDRGIIKNSHSVCVDDGDKWMVRKVHSLSPLSKFHGIVTQYQFFPATSVWGPSIKNIRFFGPFFDLPTHPYPIFSHTTDFFR